MPVKNKELIAQQLEKIVDYSIKSAGTRKGGAKLTLTLHNPETGYQSSISYQSVTPFQWIFIQSVLNINLGEES